MARQIINIGTSPNKGDGDPLRSAFDKINDNFAELYAGNNVDPNNTGTNLIPDTDGTRDLGSSTKRWADAYIKDFIYLNGARIEVDANGVLLVNGSTASQRADVVGDLFGQDSTKAFDSNTNTFYGTLEGDVNGSVFADSSTKVIDGLTGEIYGNLNGTLVGNVTGDVVGDLTGDVDYTPANAAQWDTPRPTTLAEAIDKLAAAVYAVNGNTPI
jgi:hypothetical protein